MFSTMCNSERGVYFQAVEQEENYQLIDPAELLPNSRPVLTAAAEQETPMRSTSSGLLIYSRAEIDYSRFSASSVSNSRDDRDGGNSVQLYSGRSSASASLTTVSLLADSAPRQPSVELIVHGTGPADTHKIEDSSTSMGPEMTSDRSAGEQKLAGDSPLTSSYLLADFHDYLEEISSEPAEIIVDRNLSETTDVDR